MTDAPEVEHGRDGGGTLPGGDVFALVVGDELARDPLDLLRLAGPGGDTDEYGNGGEADFAGGEDAALPVLNRDGAVGGAGGGDREDDAVLADAGDEFWGGGEVDFVAHVVGKGQGVWVDLDVLRIDRAGVVGVVHGASLLSWVRASNLRGCAACCVFWQLVPGRLVVRVPGCRGWSPGVGVVGEQGGGDAAQCGGDACHAGGAYEFVAAYLGVDGAGAARIGEQFRDLVCGVGFVADPGVQVGEVAGGSQCDVESVGDVFVDYGVVDVGWA
nr:hypothetical protein [Aldersonia kunmingensis]